MGKGQIHDTEFAYWPLPSLNSKHIILYHITSLVTCYLKWIVKLRLIIQSKYTDKTSTDRQDITEILSKVTLNIIKPTNQTNNIHGCQHIQFNTEYYVIISWQTFPEMRRNGVFHQLTNTSVQFRFL